MQLVEIEDASITALRSRHPDDEPPPGIPAASHHPVLRWWPLAAVAVVCLVAATMLASARDRAFVRHIGAVPGLVRPLDAAPAPLWEVPGRTANGAVLAADGALVVVGEGNDAWDVTAHDPTTGDVLWTVPVGQAPRSGFESGGVTCPAQGADVGSVVLCLVPQPRVLYSDDASIQEEPRITVLALSASDGTRTGGWEIRGDVVGVERVDDDLVVGRLAPDNHLEVQRRDGRSGAVVWSYRTPADMAQLLSASMRVLPPIVVLDGESTIILDAGDGHTLVAGARFSGLQASALRGRFATWAPAGGGHMHDVDGAELYRLSGLPAQLSATTAPSRRAWSSTRARSWCRSTWARGPSSGARCRCSTRACSSATGSWCRAPARTGCSTPPTAASCGPSTPATRWGGSRSPTAPSSWVRASRPTDGRSCGDARSPTGCGTGRSRCPSTCATSTPWAGTSSCGRPAT